MRLVFQWRPAPWSLILASLFLISHAATGQLALPSTNVSFGNVPVGTSSIVPIAISNTGESTLTISQATVSGTGFSFAGPNLPLTVAPQRTANLSVAFAPTVAGSTSGSLIVSASFSWGDHYRHHWRSATVLLSGTGFTMTPTPPPTPGYLNVPSSMNLGSVLVGASQTQMLTLSNSGGSSLTISAATPGGSGFSVSGLAFPYALGAGKSAALAVTFAPTATGTDSVTLSLTSNASDASVAVALLGTGTSSTTTGSLAVTPISMNFGNVNVGVIQSQNGNVSATGGSVTLSSAASSNPQFTLGGLTLPTTIAAGNSVPFTLTFSPTAPGTSTATISFFGSGSSSTAETVTGVGATIQHIVALSWNPSTSTSVSGYNVYRSAAVAGPYSRINPSLDSSLSFSDSTVKSGQTYYYVTTAVDPSGIESAYSNQVQALVPMP